MLANTNQSQIVQQEKLALSQHVSTITAVFIGLLLGGFISYMWPTLPRLAQLGSWLLSIAFSFVMTSFFTLRLQGHLRWDFLFFGQISGIIGVGLFFLTTL